MREYQMSKVYRAEREWWKTFRGPADLSLEQIETLARQIMTAHGMGNMPLKIRDGRGHRNATAYRSRYGWCELTFPRWSRSRAVVCHEVAHLVAGTDMGHGWSFCSAYVRIVREFMGPHEAAGLVEAFRKHRVKLYDHKKAGVAFNTTPVLLPQHGG